MMLTKSRTVLQQSADALPFHRIFVSVEDERDGLAPMRSVVIDEVTFIDMGAPFVITVTIEPGDKLNTAG